MLPSSDGSIKPLYRCPNCGAPTFVVCASHPRGYAVGNCLLCGESGCIEWPAEPIAESDGNKKGEGEYHVGSGETG